MLMDIQICVCTRAHKHTRTPLAEEQIEESTEAECISGTSANVSYLMNLGKTIRRTN